MGAWGFGAFANDVSLDLLENLHDELIRRIVIGLNSEYYEEQRAAAVLLAHYIDLPKFSELVFFRDTDLGHSTISEHCLFGHAVSVLDQMMVDQDWINTWRDTEEILIALSHDRDFVQNKWTEYQKSN